MSSCFLTIRRSSQCILVFIKDKTGLRFNLMSQMEDKRDLHWEYSLLQTSAKDVFSEVNLKFCNPNIS